MIDSTDAAVMERALTYCQGKAVLNSINLEDGLERLREGGAAGAALRRRAGGRPDRREGHGGDRRAQARGGAPQLPHPDRGDGRRARGHLVGPAGLPLRHRRRGLPRLGGGRRSRGCAALKARVPALARRSSASRTSSFGLPPAGREVLNSVFLYHCTQAGLDAAIVNTERLARYAEIPEEERALAEALIFLAPGDIAAGERGGGGVHRALPRPRQRRGGEAAARELPLDERLARAVVEGTQGGARGRPRRGARRSALAGAARRHQRPADGRHGARSAGCSTTTS